MATLPDTPSHPTVSTKMTGFDVHCPTLSKPGAQSYAYAPLYYFVFPGCQAIVFDGKIAYNAIKLMPSISSSNSLLLSPDSTQPNPSSPAL